MRPEKKKKKKTSERFSSDLRPGSERTEQPSLVRLARRPREEQAENSLSGRRKEETLAPADEAALPCVAGGEVRCTPGRRRKETGRRVGVTGPT